MVRDLRTLDRPDPDELDDDPRDVDEPDNRDPLDEFDLDEFLGSFPESRQVFVFRRDRGKSRFLDGLDVDGLTLQTLRDLFGGGKFQLRLRDRSGKWLPGSRMVEIEGPAKVYKGAVPAEEQGDDDDDEPDDLATLRDQVGALAGLVSKLVNQGPALANPPGDRLDDFLKMARLMKELRPDTPAAPAASDNPLNHFLQGLELGRELVGSGGGSGLGSLAERMALPLIDMMQHANKNPAASLPAAPAPEGPTLDASKLPNPAPRWATFLPPMLPDLATWAEAGKDPELCADWIVDNIPPGYQTPILAEVRRPELLRELAAAFEPARLFPEWFGAFVERVKIALGDDEWLDGEGSNEGG